VGRAVHFLVLFLFFLGRKIKIFLLVGLRGRQERLLVEAGGVEGADVHGEKGECASGDKRVARDGVSE